MNKLPCEVVRDLFPSYIDELTSEVTKELVDEHVAECAECHQVLDSMRTPVTDSVDEKNKAEIDFLKKTRKKNRKNIWIAVAAVLGLFLLAVVVRNYFIGTAIPSEYMACQVEVRGKELTINGAVIDERFRISDVIFSEENGVVTISFKCVQKSPFFDSSVEQTYNANQEITEVHLGERILWARGENISAITSAVYQTKHLYIGDASANGKTAMALNMSMALGSYKNELQTTTEPYGWHFLLDWQVGQNSYDELVKKTEIMDAYAYVLLAVIDNLGEVTYEHTWEGHPAWHTVTKEQATKFAGEDIKAVGKDIAKLQQLMEKADLIDTAYVMDYSQWNSEKKIEIELVNLTEDELFSIALYCYLGDVCNSQEMSNADGSMLEKGTVANYELLPEVFEDAWSKEEELVFRIGIRNKDGKYQECVERINLPAEFGYTYRYKLTGSMEEGYHISQ